MNPMDMLALSGTGFVVVFVIMTALWTFAFFQFQAVLNVFLAPPLLLACLNPVRTAKKPARSPATIAEH